MNKKVYVKKYDDIGGIQSSSNFTPRWLSYSRAKRVYGENSERQMHFDIQ